MILCAPHKLLNAFANKRAGMGDYAS